MHSIERIWCSTPARSPIRFSLTGELSGVRFVSSDPPQLLATTGIQFSATDSLDLSLVVLVGFLEGSDRYGALLGVSPKIHFFH